MNNFEKRFISRAEDLIDDLYDIAGDCDTRKLFDIGRFGWLLTVGRHYPDDEFLTEEEFSILSEGERIWRQSLEIEDERLALVRAWIDASKVERDIGLGLYCCAMLMSGMYRNEDEAIVLFRVASERYAFAIMAPIVIDLEAGTHGEITGVKNHDNNPAAEMARRRHKEHYELSKYAIDHWHKNIDKKLSASKAAEELIGIVKLSHKKLAELISAEKKKVT
ncbi:hypothetical protein [Paraburkholderia sp. RL17-337-BIB-A]|uniref:hypothetical protein n=1 Tax=Paraburkholderia sp. RL17-337-BIB-A TaxID=3031636 RepID=UPI0038BCF0DB